MDIKLLDILACPICKAPLHYRHGNTELVCKADRLAFPIREGFPVLLQDEARQIPPTEEIE